ncbi:MAG: NAD(+) synthase [Clostridia bacterium]|nr:NAD(+) synthase [Clostridia bacterium]
MPALSGMIRAMAAVPRVYLADPSKNAEEIAALLKTADQQGAQLCVFPELCLTGYTCADLFLQDALLRAALDALRTLCALPVKTAFAVGLPLSMNGRLYNCAAVICGGRLLGIVPKEHLPNSGEFYERRWFEPGHGAPDKIRLLGQDVPVGQDLCFDCGTFSFGVEICEDLWVPQPPSGRLAMGGALLIANPSAGNELVTKHRYRCELISQQSARCLCGYVYAGAGYGESTTDLVFSGYAGVFENGRTLAQNERFARGASYSIADIDIERLQFKRRQNRSFWDDTLPPLRTVSFAPPPRADEDLLRALSPTPFVPDGAERSERTEEILLIQTQALLTRMEHVHTQKAVVGVSGGLDSTLTLLAAAFAFERAGWDKRGIIGITMPGFGTGTRTRGNAERLMELIGCTSLTVPIGPAVTQHFADIGQSPDVHDICYENSQARERTQIVMDYANKVGALALGTGDLSELALGWCTYNGDQMSMYNMSASVPKTLIRHLVRYVGGKLGGDILPVVLDILDTPISPELIPGKEGELTQRTEDTLGAYALHDFFLYHMMDSGASPAKLFALARRAFAREYDDAAILTALSTFVRRFFTQQFKRSAMPDGPKVGSVSLSPRGDWRMPSDAQMRVWMDEVDALSRAMP